MNQLTRPPPPVSCSLSILSTHSRCHISFKPDSHALISLLFRPSVDPTSPPHHPRNGPSGLHNAAAQDPSSLPPPVAQEAASDALAQPHHDKCRCCCCPASSTRTCKWRLACARPGTAPQRGRYERTRRHVAAREGAERSVSRDNITHPVRRAPPIPSPQSSDAWCAMLTRGTASRAHSCPSRTA